MPACRSAYQSLERVYQDYLDSDVEVLAVISKADRERLSSLNRALNVSFTTLADPQDVIRGLYAARRNPTILIIDKEGIVRYVGGSTQWTTLRDKIESIRASDNPT
jgi:hypothetical protein